MHICRKFKIFNYNTLSTSMFSFPFPFNIYNSVEKRPEVNAAEYLWSPNNRVGGQKIVKINKRIVGYFAAK